MSTEKMRHAFEQFIIRRDGSIWVTVLGDQRSYNEPIERDFSVWCESRAAIEVELLPRVTSEEVAEHLGIDDDTALDISHMINGAIIACGGMIKAAGLKVKP
ncbi:hypothetical protein D7M10_11690 [Pseudomonas fluorescens]|nr:hypothetical protein D7M10_11690 [Pseudomonas fluorescens]